MIFHVENEVKRLLTLSRLLLALAVLVLIPGTLIALPLGWWLARHRAAQGRGAHG